MWYLQIRLFFLRRFLDMEIQRKVMVLQQRVKELENENSVLRQRLTDALSGKVIAKYKIENIILLFYYIRMFLKANILI